MDVVLTFETYAEQLRAQAKEVEKQYQHSFETGEPKEALLKRFLDAYLPRKYSTAKGYVFDCYGLSREADLAIYDTAGATPLPGLGSPCFLCEDVYGVIEVKSRLTTKQLADAFEKIAFFKAMHRLHETAREEDSPGHENVEVDRMPMFGVIFAFESPAFESIDDIKQEAARIAEDYPSERCPGMICVLDKGLLGAYLCKWRQNAWAQLRGDLTLFEFYWSLRRLLVATPLEEPRLGFYQAYSLARRWPAEPGRSGSSSPDV